MTLCDPNIVDRIRAYAHDHYNEGGWDFVVECYEDEDILAFVVEGSTFESVRDAMAESLGHLDERRREIQSTAF